jgi:DNA-directed RNA polymerase specialized sigma24 family protein
MDPEEYASSLVERLRQGDPQAAEHLFTRYAERLIRLAELHLSSRLGGRLDGEDVVQSALRTVFRRHAGGEFRINSSAELWRLMARITLLKARAKGRHHTAARRSVADELPGIAAGLPELLAGDPGPDEAAILVDEIEVLLNGLLVAPLLAEP